MFLLQRNEMRFTFTGIDSQTPEALHKCHFTVFSPSKKKLRC